MEKTCYVALKYSHRKKLYRVVWSVLQLLTQKGFQPYVFVDEYKKLNDDNPQMMHEAMQQIKKSRLLIAETSSPSTGVGIEIGIAKSFHIPIFCIQKERARRSSTILGTADVVISYRSLNDLSKKLEKALQTLY